MKNIQYPTCNRCNKQMFLQTIITEFNKTKQFIFKCNICSMIERENRKGLNDPWKTFA